MNQMDLKERLALSDRPTLKYRLEKLLQQWPVLRILHTGQRWVYQGDHDPAEVA
jgi:hypothetical protein